MTSWKKRYSTRTYPNALGGSLQRHLQHDHGMNPNAIEFVQGYIDDLKPLADKNSAIGKFERIPNESQEEFAHRVVHDIRDGEWDSDQISGDSNHHHAKRQRTIVFPNIKGARALKRHMQLEHQNNGPEATSLSLDEEKLSYYHNREHSGPTGIYESEYPGAIIGVKHIHE